MGILANGFPTQQLPFNKFRRWKIIAVLNCLITSERSTDLLCIKIGTRLRSDEAVTDNVETVRQFYYDVAVSDIATRGIEGVVPTQFLSHSVRLIIYEFKALVNILDRFLSCLYILL